MSDASPINSPPEQSVDFSQYTQGDYTPGRGVFVRCLWMICSLLIFEPGWCPWSGLKVCLLRIFGASMGHNVVIKPNVRIKFPWRLTVGDHVWIGQEAWIDNLANVTLDSHVCLSQRVYLCTGSHDHRKVSFDLINQPIAVASGGWVCAGAILLPGTKLGANAIVSAGSVVQGEIDASTIVKGNPAIPVGTRSLKERELTDENGE